jgi:hypothetical protein
MSVQTKDLTPKTAPDNGSLTEYFIAIPKRGQDHFQSGWRANRNNFSDWIHWIDVFFNTEYFLLRNTQKFNFSIFPLFSVFRSFIP